MLGLDGQMYVHMVCNMLRNAIIVAPRPVKFLSHLIPAKHLMYYIDFVLRK